MGYPAQSNRSSSLLRKRLYPIVDSIISPDTLFYSCRHIAKNSNVANGRWTGFFMACGEGNILPAFMQDMFYDYWMNHKRIVTYLFIDYLFAIAYDEIPAVTEMVKDITLQKISNLAKYLNMPFSKNAMQKFEEIYSFHKLTYKKQFQTHTPNGRETIYGYLLSRKF